MYMQQLNSGLDLVNTTWNAQVEGYSIEKTNKRTKQNMVNIWASAAYYLCCTENFIP